ncbi:beta-agarase-like [Liolophura sinensis]|uniref:beta-agarase-like n=1 Tax=Liolophura sinensis TaxID=3198878 RepID=UPI0031593E72
MAVLLCTFLLALAAAPAISDYTVTIFPEYLSQNKRSHFEGDRWDNHNGLDQSWQIAKNKDIGTESGRWMNRDLNSDIFKNTPENPHQRGYADPNHFNSQNMRKKLADYYLQNVHGYGKDLDTVMVIRAHGDWPHWMDTSHHGGQFPNNIDAAADMAAQMFDAINHYTGGIHPPYFEVMNEPDAQWKYMSWETVIEFHRVMAQKLKAKVHGVKVGGPTYTSAITSANKNDFRVWKNIKQFLDMSLYHLDFFSFHPYNSFHSHGGSHSFAGTNEARLVAIIDLVHSYTHHKRGFSVPLIVSEYGLGNLDVDSHTPNAVSQWAYAYLHNAYMFTFLNHRGVMESAVAFILSHDNYGFEQASLFDTHHAETFVAKGYRFWKHFGWNHQFLRVDSQHNGAERTISPLAMADPHTKKVYVLLHNYHSSSTTVKLNFNNRWITPTAGWATCIYLENNRNPVFKENESIHLNDGKVTLRGESTCFYTFQTGHDFGRTPTIEEHTYYATDQVYHINNNVAQATVNLPNSGNHHSAFLRIGVSNKNKGAHTTPRSVHINGHSINDHYSLFDNNRHQSDTLWDVIIYNVPTNVLNHGSNTVRLEFPQSGGYVSSVALVVGDVNGNPGIIG